MVKIKNVRYFWEFNLQIGLAFSKHVYFLILFFFCLKYFLLKCFLFKLLILMEFSQSYKLLRSLKKQDGYMVLYLFYI